MKLKSVLLAALLASAAIPALAQTPMPEDPLDDRSVKRVERMEKVVRELRAIVFQGRDTGKPVVVQPAETEAQILTLGERIGDLEQTLQRVNGQNETLTHDLDQARRASAEQKTRGDALEARLAALEAKLTALETAAVQAAHVTETPAPPAPPADPAVAFKQARQFLLDGDYTNAEAAFSAYVANYPDNARTPEARYWLGETLFVREAYGDAAGSYLGAVRGWPQTSWAPDATLKLSRALVALKKPADACKTLDELAKRYPKAPPAVVSRAASTRVAAKCA